MTLNYLFIKIYQMWGIVLLLLLLTIVLALPFDFSNPRDFYHNISRLAHGLILHNSRLEDDETLLVQLYLLAHPTFGVSDSYDRTCNFITKDRAIMLLRLSVGDKSREERLLGATCLTDTIIDARKSIPKMWPPSGIPLLIDGLGKGNLKDSHCRAILESALEQPELWESGQWLWQVDWSLGSLKFWRMIPIDAHLAIHRNVFPYLVQSITEPQRYTSPRDIEELLIKSIRLLTIMNNHTASKVNNVLCGPSSFVRNLHNLDSEWCAKVHGFFFKMCTDGSIQAMLTQALVSSDLLLMNTWQAMVDAGEIGKATAINDILELFTLAIIYGVNGDQSDKIQQLLVIFLGNLDDLSVIRPLTMKTLVIAIDKGFGMDFLEKYAQKLINSQHLFPTLCKVLPLISQDTRLIGCKVKGWTGPLKDSFIQKMARPRYSLGHYVDMLYLEWTRHQERENRPEIDSLHEYTSAKFRNVLKPSLFEIGTWEPKTDNSYQLLAWETAFSSIKFDILYGIPSKAVLSLCFLRALLYHYKNPDLNWEIFRQTNGKECPFPQSRTEQDRYEEALNAAINEFFHRIPQLLVSAPEVLQAIIRGSSYEGSTNEHDALSVKLGALQLN